MCTPINASSRLIAALKFTVLNNANLVPSVIIKRLQIHSP